MSDASETSDDSEYASDEDEDYIPEESASEEEIEKKETSRKRKNTKDKRKPAKRKRKRGIQLDDDDEDDDDDDEVSFDDDESDEEIAVEEEKEEEEIEKEEIEKEEIEKEETSKSRVDDLWAEFKKDTASAIPSKKGTNAGNTEDLKNKSQSNETVTASKEAPKKVEITEIFDFAGEEVKVVKSVDASSIQAKTDTESNEDLSAIKPSPATMKKKPTGLGSVLGKIGKKPKLSTLEKSKLDWTQFKKQEGIEDDLKTSNKDGYLEKTAFLNRVDQKQFEIERDIRQGARKR